MFYKILSFVNILFRKHIFKYSSIKHHLTGTQFENDLLLIRLEQETKELYNQYQNFMKNTFCYYDTVRFITLDMIYNVFKKHLF